MERVKEEVVRRATVRAGHRGEDEDGVGAC